MLTLENLTKTYDENGNATHALRAVNFTISGGEFVAIMGPSGSGKSTLLSILSFLDRPTSGDYQFFGERLNALTDTALALIRNRDMGFIFQSFNLLGRATVYENVELPLVYSHLKMSERKKRIVEAVRSVGLEDKLFTEAGKLSGGQKQRVAIARALVTDPKIIFADEPTGNLDSANGAQVMQILADLHKKGKTVLLVTHETYTAEFAERIIRLKDGAVESDILVIKQRSNKEDFVK